MELVYTVKGSIVPRLCNRNGHRYDRKGALPYGGARIKYKKMNNETWHEPLAASVFENRKEFIESRYITALGGDETEINSNYNEELKDEQ